MNIIKVSPIEVQNTGEKHFITSPYGERIVKRTKGFHHGVDLVRYDGKHKMISRIINPFEKAVVIHTKEYSRAGKAVILLDISENCKRDFRVFGIFCHLEKWYDGLSSVLSQGEAFALMGNTGHSIGAHLHFGLCIVDKKDFIDLGGLITGLFSVNPVEWGLEG